MAMVQNVFRTGYMLNEIYRINSAFIPKVDYLNLISHYPPISLRNGSYKIPYEVMTTGSKVLD